MGGKLPTQTYHDIAPQKANFEYLRNKLKLKQLEAKKSFAEKFPHVEKFLKEKGIDLSKLREHSAKIIGAGAIAGTLLLTPPSGAKSLPAASEVLEKIKAQKAEAPDVPQKLLVDTLTQALPAYPRPLTKPEEKNLEQVFQNVIGVANLAIGGTSVLIVVSVVLETTKALEAQLVMRNYEGFL